MYLFLSNVFFLLSSLLHLFYIENNPKSLNLQACVKRKVKSGFRPQKAFSLKMTKVISLQKSCYVSVVVLTLSAFLFKHSHADVTCCHMIKSSFLFLFSLDPCPLWTYLLTCSRNPVQKLTQLFSPSFLFPENTTEYFRVVPLTPSLWFIVKI